MEIFGLTNEQFLLFFLIVLVGAVYFFLRMIGKSEQARRLVEVFPLVLQQISMFIERADQEFERIMEEYAEEAAKENVDARLLWVVDQVLKWQRQNVPWLNLNREWIIDQVEVLLKERSAKG